MRVATVDIGTNTVLLLVAETSARGDLRAVEERATITRLGEGVDRTRSLAPAAIERTGACLDDYARIVREAGVERVAVVGTSAMRDAGGGEAILARVRAAFGVDARTISGEEEAGLTFAGAVSGLGLAAGDAIVFDVGGGSTEVVWGAVGGNGEAASIRYAESFDVGSVRLTERHVRSDPPGRVELGSVAAAAREAFARIPDSVAIGSEVEPVGIAGTMTTLAAVSLGLTPYDGARVHGHVMTTGELSAVVSKLAAMTLAERRAAPGLDPKRADVIVAGGTIALSFLERFGSTRVRISDRGVRWGLAQELVTRTSA